MDFFIAFRCQHFIFLICFPMQLQKPTRFLASFSFSLSLARQASISSEVVVKIIDYKVTRQAVSDYNKYYKLSRYFANKFTRNTFQVFAMPEAKEGRVDGHSPMHFCLQKTPSPAAPAHFVFKLDIYFTTKFKNVVLLVLQVVMPLNRYSKNIYANAIKTVKTLLNLIIYELVVKTSCCAPWAFRPKQELLDMKECKATEVFRELPYEVATVQSLMLWHLTAQRILFSAEICLCSYEVITGFKGSEQVGKDWKRHKSDFIFGVIGKWVQNVNAGLTRLFKTQTGGNKLSPKQVLNEYLSKNL